MSTANFSPLMELSQPVSIFFRRFFTLFLDSSKPMYKDGRAVGNANRQSTKADRKEIPVPSSLIGSCRRFLALHRQALRDGQNATLFYIFLVYLFSALSRHGGNAQCVTVPFNKAAGNTMETTNIAINPCGLLDIINGGLSKNEERNVKALLTCEESFKARLEESGLKKGGPGYADFQREYNAFLKVKMELVAKGMEPGRATDKIHYGNPDKDRGAIRGGYRPDSAIAKAHETIRTLRRQAFDKSRTESLLPAEVSVYGIPLSDKVWSELALALHAVPYSYRVATESGNLVHNRETSEAYCKARTAEIIEARQQLADEMEEAAKMAEQAKNTEGKSGKRSKAA